MFSDEESLESDSCSLTSWIVMDLLLMTGLVMQKGNLLKGIDKKTINVSTAEKYTKCTSILLLRLVRFSAVQTLEH